MFKYFFNCRENIRNFTLSNKNYIYKIIHQHILHKKNILMIICRLNSKIILQNDYICRNLKLTVMRTITKILLCAFCMLFINNIYAQNENNDCDINKIITHENRFERLIYLANTYSEKNSEFAFNSAYKAQKIAHKTNNLRQIATSNIVIGDILQKNSSYDYAISYYEKAIEQLIMLKEYDTIYKMYIKIADMYNDENQIKNYDKELSIESMKQAIIFANKSNNQEGLIETYLAFGDIYYKQRKYENAIICYDNILKYSTNHKNINTFIEALTKKAEMLINIQKYDMAMPLIDSSLSLCASSNNMKMKMNNYGLKAIVYDSLNNFEAARDNYIKAIKLAYSECDYEICGKNMYNLGKLKMRLETNESAINVFKILSDSTDAFKMFEICYHSYFQLSKCYANMNNYEEAYNYFNKYDIYCDSATNIENKRKIEQLHIGNKLTLNIEELKKVEQEESNNKSLRFNWIISIIMIVILSSVLVVFIILFSRNKLLYHKNKEKSYEQQLKIDEMENDLMEIQLKNSKESLINMALHLKSYIEYIDPLKKELKEIIDSPDDEIKGKVKNVYANMQNNISLFNNIESLNKQINEIYKDFFDRLDQKFPGITKSEKRLCVMLYLNMSSKEISIITNTTLRSVETSRYRLRKKFNLLRDEDMVNFLRNI